MVIKNIVINYDNNEFHIEELNCKSINSNKNEIKLNSIISDVINEILTDKKFINTAMKLKK